MPNDLERPYRVYRSGGEASEAPPPDTGDRRYKLYRSHPRGLMARLRGEPDLALPGADPGRRDRGPGGPRRRRLRRVRITPLRLIGALVGLIVGWILLSLILFMISAQVDAGGVPKSVTAALSSGGNMLTSADNVLILGTDQRPPGSKEPGAFAGGVRSDTIMVWRVGGGTSRRLSIPRDTVASIPGHGTSKINAAYAYGGPALAIKTVQQLTGLKINHVIIVNLDAFPKFIDDIGGITIKTGRICSDISGGTANGGFSLYLKPGTHHLTGAQALTLARTRENKCNPAENDITRTERQQQILNSVKSQLLSVGTFFHLPWVAWDAPKVLRTDMGGPTLLTLFAASEIGGSAPVQVLKPSGSVTLPDGGSALNVTSGAIHKAVDKLVSG